MRNAGILAFVFVAAFSLSVAPVLSQSTDNGTDDIQPDSFFYAFDVFFDDMMLAFTSDDVEKAKLSLKVADERLEEAKLMIKLSKFAAADEARVQHEKMMDVTEDAVEGIEDDDAVEEIEEEIEVERELENHRTRIKEVTDELKVDIKVRGDLTDDQQALIDSILAAMDGKSGKVSIVIDNEKDETKIKIVQTTGKTEDEVEEDVHDIERRHGLEGLKVKGEIFGAGTEVKVERKIILDDVNRSTIIGAIIEQFALDNSTADENLVLVEEDDNHTHSGEELRARVEVRDGEAFVQVRLRFVSNSTDRAAIVSEIVERTQLTTEELENVLRFRSKSDDIRIDVKVEEGVAEVRAEYGENRTEFETDFTNLDELVAEIAERTGLTTDQVDSGLKFEVKHHDEDDGHDEMEEHDRMEESDEMEHDEIEEVDDDRHESDEMDDFRNETDSHDDDMEEKVDNSGSGSDDKIEDDSMEEKEDSSGSDDKIDDRNETDNSGSGSS